VIVPTEKVKELLRAYHVRRNIEVIPTGIDLDKFDKFQYSNEEIDQLRESCGIQKTDKVIMYLGRLSQEKNIEELLQYMPSYLEKHRGVKFVLIGGGPDSSHLKEMTKELQADQSILFLGEKPYDEVGKYYQLGNVFVSASNSETQGLTFIEAMASGLPVVAKEDRCLDGILSKGGNGYFFRDEQEFHAALDTVLYSGKEELLRQNARNTAYRFSTHEFANEVLDVYTEVIKRREVAYV
jgi:1,2-diacylglycerol 3-alpha-glucosyltransferase